ncbi:hypothetical protein O4H49_20020 [Kiloniella laminariae]|uniref:Lipoprotein n=1 Tax=Kiloniella laminariae TaxID=454162 RepID=A0ABT4LPR4_9PROT|nr:hypothetical protein [Kiloniella laminariae]MCZ4283082.1 hypothetical protein [Kiloniella laminariae]
MARIVICFALAVLASACSSVGNGKKEPFVAYSERPVIYDLHPVRVELRPLTEPTKPNDINAAGE